MPNENEAVWVATETGAAYLYPQHVAAVLYVAPQPGTIREGAALSVQVILTGGVIVYLHDERSFEEIARLLLQGNFPEPK
jgi:hypothetical protein